MTPDRPDELEPLLKAIAHPLRHRILLAIDEAGETSPKVVARALDEPLGRVAHHVRVLVRLGVIELVRTEPRRGATEHYYRAAMKAWFDDETWATLPGATRRSVLHTTLRRLIGSATDAARGTGFEHPKVHVSYVLLDLDEQGMDEVAATLGDALERVEAIREQAAARLGDAPATLRTELGILHFERT